MKKILVLVLALLCVFSVAAFATETTAAPQENPEKLEKIEFGEHRFYAYPSAIPEKDQAMLKELGFKTASNGYEGYYTHTGNTANVNYALCIFGSTDATCTEGKKLKLLCADPGCTAADENGFVTVTVTKPLDHKLFSTALEKDSANKDATCKETGIKVWNCPDCGRWEETLPVKAHSYLKEGAIVTTPATCYAPETTVKTCDFCSDIKTTTSGTKLEHVYGPEVVIYEPATCLKEGKAAMMSVCQNEGCNAINPEFVSTYVELPKLDHLDTEVGGAHVFEERFASYFSVMEKDGKPVLNKEGIPYIKVTDVPAATADELKVEENKFRMAGEDGVMFTQDDILVDDKDCPWVTLHGKYTYTFVAPKCGVEGSLTITCENCGVSAKYAIKALEHTYVVEKINGLEVEKFFKDNKLDCTKGYIVYVECHTQYEFALNWECDDAFQQNTLVHEGHHFTSAVLNQKLNNNTTRIAHIVEGEYESIDKAIAAYLKSDECEIEACMPYTITYECNCELENAVQTNLELECGYTLTVDKAATADHVCPTGEDGYVDLSNSMVYDYEFSTCCEPGYVAYTCVNCYSAARDDWKIDEDAHKVTLTLTPATCVEDGKYTGVCELCKENIEIIVPKTGHEWDVESDDYENDWNVEPKTCTEDGKYYRTCGVCGTEESVVIPAGHTYDIKKAISYTEPLCSRPGKISYYCTVCHDSVTDEVIPQLKHDFDDGVRIAEATCCVGAQYLQQCANCKTYRVVEVTKGPEKAYGHAPLDADDLSDIKEAIKAGEDNYLNIYYYQNATCETAGKGKMLCEKAIKIYTCNPLTGEYKIDEDASYICDHEWDFEIPAFGHSWSVVVDPVTGAFYCECDKTEVHKAETDEYGNVLYGCGATDKVESRTPEFEIEIEGKVGTLTKVDDNMSNLTAPVYVRIVLDFQTKDGVSTSLIFMANVTFKDEVGTFKVPVVKTGMTMTGASYIVVTDENADELRYSQITNKYGELNL